MASAAGAIAHVVAPINPAQSTAVLTFLVTVLTLLNVVMALRSEVFFGVGGGSAPSDSFKITALLVKHAAQLWCRTHKVLVSFR